MAESITETYFDFGNSSAVNDTLVDPVENATAAIPAGYCGDGLREFTKSYRLFHAYISLTVCIFGAFANILNLIVLTRKEMINPTNAILTGLALADLLNMLEYIPYAVYMILPGSKTYAWAVFVLIHSNFSQVCHTISIWLTVTLAVWRYIMVAMHTKCKTLCSMDRAKWAIASAYITSPILCIPIYLSFSITPLYLAGTGPDVTTPSPANSTMSMTEVSDSLSISTTMETTTAAPPDNGMYIVNLSELAKDHDFLLNLNFWLYSVVIKLFPCGMLTVVSLRLINSLMEAKKRKDKLLAKRTVPIGNHAVAPGAGNASRGGSDHESGGSDRTTRMLLAVLLLFLITEFPQGLLGLLSCLLGDAFFKSCYIPLADPMDFIALLNSAINFILYCSMSKKFRETFSKLFHLDQLMKFGRRHGGRNNLSKTGPIPNNHTASPKTHLQLLADRERDHLPV